MQKIAKYLQIENDIIEDIKNGVLKPGDKVASESTLKKKYNVSTITVRKAFNDLINSGYLFGIQGVGTFVTKKQMIRGLTSISFSEELEQQGYNTTMVIDSIDVVYNSEIATKMSLEADSKLICVKRVRLANDEPIAYHTSYIAAKYIDENQMADLHNTKSLYKTFSNFHLTPSWVNENYSIAEIMDPNIYQQMNVKRGCAAFFVKRLTYNEFDEVIEYAETYFNKDWYSVTVNIKA